MGSAWKSTGDSREKNVGVFKDSRKLQLTIASLVLPRLASELWSMFRMKLSPAPTWRKQPKLERMWLLLNLGHGCLSFKSGFDCTLECAKV